MVSGVAIIAVGIVLLYITPDAVRDQREIDRYLANKNFRNFPRLRRWNLSLIDRGQWIGRLWGRTVGLLGIIAGVIVVVRSLRGSG